MCVEKAGDWEAVTDGSSVAATPSINMLPKNRRAEGERGRRWREMLQRVINKSLISRAFSPPSFPHPAQHTRLSADTHLWMPAGPLSLFSPGLGGDWFVATAPGLSDTLKAAIQSQGKVSAEAPAHTQKICSGLFPRRSAVKLPAWIMHAFIMSGNLGVSLGKTESTSAAGVCANAWLLLIESDA